MKRFSALSAVILFGLIFSAASAQQNIDHTADVHVASPAHAADTGPSVGIDAGHHNFHTESGRFAPFARLLRNDGYRVATIDEPFSASSLAALDILVIVNPLHASNVDNWQEPVRSAFGAQEIEAVRRWVEQGGYLVLIADHFPFAGAAAELAQAFGFGWLNVFAFNDPPQPHDVFSLADRSLIDHPLLRSADGRNDIPHVTTFTGSAFSAPEAAQPLIVLPDSFVLLKPRVAWEFSADTQAYPGGGYLQGALMHFGSGRLAMFGEAGMFTAQRSADEDAPIGFNSPFARHNRSFILRVLAFR